MRFIHKQFFYDILYFLRNIDNSKNFRFFFLEFQVVNSQLDINTL